MDQSKPHSWIDGLKAKDVMGERIVTLTSHHTVKQASEIMRIKGITGLPVVEDGVLAGIVSIADVLHAFEKEEHSLPVSSLMTKNVVSLTPDEPISECLFKFRKYKFGRFPVVDKDRRVIVMVTPTNILIHFINVCQGLYGPFEQEDTGTDLQMTFLIAGGDFAAAGDGSSKIKKTLKRLGLNSKIIRRASIISYELEMNIVIHALKGWIKVEVTPDEIMVSAEDEGPGISNIELAMQEGYSTASEQVREMGFGAGMGLSNIKRCSDEFKIHSDVGKGVSINTKIYINKG